MNRPAGSLAWIRQRLRRREDSEHEMMPNRLVFAAVVLAYLIIASRNGVEGAARILEATEIAFAVYLSVVACIFVHILRHPGICEARRVFAMFSDFAMMSFVACIAGPASGFLYPFYLWTVFGNGFRFGVKYILISMVVATAFFTGVVVYTGFWQQQLGLSIALIFTLVMLPLYASVLIRKLTEARRQAEEASRAKSLFLASVSHELRTPLNAIIGLSDLLQDQELPRQHREMAGTIAGAGRALLELINQVLDFSRLEAGSMPTKSVRFDLYALLDDVAGMLRFHAEQKGIALSVQITADTPREIECDRRHLQEVLVNLASNAVKFTAEGHVVIGAQMAEGSQEGARIRLEVSDTGIGIKPEAHARIFESFTQADETIIDSHGGTGLGLAICRQLVHMHGGEIGLESALGAGSTFWFELPVSLSSQAQAVADADLAVVTEDPSLEEAVREIYPDARRLASASELADAFPPASAGGERPQVVVLDEEMLGDAAELAELLAVLPDRPRVALVRRSGERLGLTAKESRWIFDAVAVRPLDRESTAAAVSAALRSGDRAVGAAQQNTYHAETPLSVLVAEDNKTNQMVIAKILEKGGHAVTLVGDGEAAIDALRSDAYDIVLMDINMPVMNGIEATKLYRFASIGQERVPIIALTADVTEETQRRCLEAGMDACASKPIEARDLLRLVAELGVSRTEGANAATVGGDDVVRELSAHPAYEKGALRLEALQALEALGGPDFVPELVRQFLGEARRLIDSFEDAAGRRDVTGARETLHALRSAAANVGAQRIYETCLNWRQTTSQELTQEGTVRTERLRQELDEAARLLAEHIQQTPPPVRFARKS